jgi:hypothetical protein
MSKILVFMTILSILTAQAQCSNVGTSVVTINLNNAISATNDMKNDLANIVKTAVEQTMKNEMKQDQRQDMKNSIENIAGQVSQKVNSELASKFDKLSDDLKEAQKSTKTLVKRFLIGWDPAWIGSFERIDGGHRAEISIMSYGTIEIRETSPNNKYEKRVMTPLTPQSCFVKGWWFGEAKESGSTFILNLNTGQLIEINFLGIKHHWNRIGTYQTNALEGDL